MVLESSKKFKKSCFDRKQFIKEMYVKFEFANILWEYKIVIHCDKSMILIVIKLWNILCCLNDKACFLIMDQYWHQRTNNYIMRPRYAGPKTYARVLLASALNCSIVSFKVKMKSIFLKWQTLNNAHDENHILKLTMHMTHTNTHAEILFVCGIEVNFLERNVSLMAFWRIDGMSESSASLNTIVSIIHSVLLYSKQVTHTYIVSY